MPDWKVVVILTLLIVIVVLAITLVRSAPKEEASDPARLEARLDRLRREAEQRAGQPSDCHALKGALILSSLVSVVALLILADCVWKARFDAEMRSLVAKRGEFRSSNRES